MISFPMRRGPSLQTALCASFIVSVRSVGPVAHDQHLHGFGQDELAVDALGGHEADLVELGVPLVQAAEGTAGTIRDPVVAVVAEGHDLVTLRDAGHIAGGVDGTAQDGIGLADIQSGLPDVVPIWKFTLDSQIYFLPS